VYDELFYQMKPNFDEFIDIIKGKKKTSRVHLVELGVDEEIMSYVWENYLNKKWVDEPVEKIKNKIEFFYSLGYDFVTFWPTVKNIPKFKKRITDDTAMVSRGKREWVEEGIGIINSWEDFKEIDWDKLDIEMKEFEVASEYVSFKDGMKLMLCTTLFEMVLERWMGYEGLFISLVRQPDLVKAVFDTWGEKIYEFYEKLIDSEVVGGIFHADDMGYRSATMINPNDLRKYVLPWLKRYADLAHSRGKVFFLHSCGNNLAIMDDLINYVGIDAYHSFQDSIIPIWEFQRRYPTIGVLGGVDVDKLARYPEKDLENYITDILEKCMFTGRFALGSGNTVTNYVPPENYLKMIKTASDFHNKNR